MAQQQHPLATAPFFLIPGISPTAPIAQQAQQIDQNNTLLLQEIDANFARFHQIITTKVLPQIKRYAIAAEPVKEGAKFWRSFYEAAAEVHVQVASEDSLAEPASNPDAEDENDETYHAPSDASFMFAEGAGLSSTPLPGRSHVAYDSSFSDSMASPFDTLERRLRDDLHLDEESEMATPSLPSGYDLTALQDQSSVVVKPSSATPKARRQGPLKDGIVDIRTTPLNAKMFRPKLSLADLDVDDDDDFGPTMSPPVTMQYGLPPKATAILPTGTPRAAPVADQNHAQRIVDDLMDEMSQEYVPSPRMPTPEALRRYSIMPGMPVPQNIFAEQIASGSGRQQPVRRSMANTSFGSDMEDVPENHVYSNDDSMDDSFDSPDPARYAYNLSTSSVGSDRSEGGTIFGGAKIQAPVPFNLMKPDEMVTFHGGRLEDAAGRDMADTPTNVRQR